MAGRSGKETEQGKAKPGTDDQAASADEAAQRATSPDDAAQRATSPDDAAQRATSSDDAAQRAAGTVDDPISPGEVQPGDRNEEAATLGGPVDVFPVRQPARRR